jgi:SRSO17 transposase
VADADRCEAAGIPTAERVARTKNELAWELIEEAERAGCAFDWIGMDAGYGRDQELLFQIAGLGKYFVADVDRDQLVWLTPPPGPQRPSSVSGSGARPVAELAAESWTQARSMKVRTTENGRLKVKFWRRRVWIWPPGSDVEIEVWLLVSQKADGQMQYSLCNGPAELTWRETAERQGQRYFVERVFEEGKSQLGMGQYQVRQWSAWQHHMALVGLAMLFTLAERAAQPGCGAWLSVRDVVEMLAWYFVKPRTAAELSEQISERHRRRQQAQASKLRRQAEAENRT